MASEDKTEAPILTGEALYELFFHVFFSEELTLTWEELHHDSRTSYDQVAQVIHERYVLPAAEVSPVVVAAWMDIMRDQENRIVALQELVREWHQQSLDPVVVHPWQERFCELRERTVKLLGEYRVSELK